MKLKITTFKTLLLATALVTLNSCSEDDAADEIQMEAWEIELEQVKTATAAYVDISVAEDEGRIDVSGFVPNMGHHYLNPALADGTFEMLKPEFILYAPDDNGVMRMVAVEYGIVPTDPENPGNAPEGFTGDQDEWHFNAEIGMWTLHVWTVLDNPDGIFASHNPTIGD